MDTERLKPGTMVFWDSQKPWWIIEWQENNGEGCYWVNHAWGHWRTARHSELSFHPRNMEDFYVELR